MNFIGIDNGVSGSIGIINGKGVFFFKTPVKKTLNYTKKKSYVTRIDFPALLELLSQFKDNSFCLIERPMVNPGRFQATASALRAFEATLIVLEELKIPHEVIDSKKWQKEFFPRGLKGTRELKKASIEVGKRLFPEVEPIHDDFDGLLIAEYCRRYYGRF